MWQWIHVEKNWILHWSWRKPQSNLVCKQNSPKGSGVADSISGSGHEGKAEPWYKKALEELKLIDTSIWSKSDFEGDSQGWEWPRQAWVYSRSPGGLIKAHGVGQSLGLFNSPLPWSKQSQPPKESHRTEPEFRQSSLPFPELIPEMENGEWASQLHLTQLTSHNSHNMRGLLSSGCSLFRIQGF